MARFEDGCYGTAAGIALIAKVLAGRCRMEYTRVSVGKGSIPEDMTPKTMTGPADYIMDAVISGVTNPVDGECQVTVQINSAQVEHGFYATNLVLYANDPDDGEIAFTYLYLENEPEWIRPASSIVGKLATFDIIAAVGDVDAVYASIDPEAIATIQRVTQMIDLALSKTSATSIVELTIPAAGWTEAETPTEDYTYICDVEVEGVTAEHWPTGGVDVGSFGVAGKAGVVGGCETMDGYIRFYSKRIPTDDIYATIGLISTGQGGIGAAGGTTTVKVLDQAEYDALEVKDETTLYFIRG